MELNELIKDAHENAVKHGFWDEINSIKNPLMNNQMNNAISTLLMLIVGEVAEAQEGLRKNDAPNFREELADVAIRLVDLCGGLDIDLEAEITRKMKINANRPYKHGKVF